MSKRIVVVGHGMVGQRFLEALTKDGAADLAITMLAEEPRLAYDRVNLSKYFSGTSVEDLTLTTREFFDKNGIELYSGDPVAAIDRANKRVITKSGAEYEYDILILATGSSPFVPPIPGRERPGVFVYRTIEDLEAITEAGKNSTRGVVIGGGLLGLEAAKALKDLGLATNVVEFAPRLMAVQVDEGGGGLLRSRIEALGVAVHTGKNTTRIDDGESARHRMHFADGGSLETDVVVISAGIRPRDELARACGLEVAPRGGIVINGDCRTSDESIYAIGECAAYEGRIFGLVAPGYQMARIAAARVLGEPKAKSFAGADMSTKLKLLGVEVGSIGDAHAHHAGRARVFVLRPAHARSTRSWWSTPRARSCSAPCWSATPLTTRCGTRPWRTPWRCRRTRKPCCFRRRAASCGCTPDQRAGCAAGNSTGLLLQQRVQGRHLLGHRRLAAPRSAR